MEKDKQRKQINNSREFYRWLKDALRCGLMERGISEETATTSINEAIIASTDEHCGTMYFPQKLTIDVLIIAPTEATSTPKPQRIPYFDDSESGDFYAGLFDCVHDGLTCAGIAESLADSQTDSAVIAIAETHGGDVMYFPQRYQSIIDHTMNQLTKRGTA